MKVLITGGAGFIGSALIRYLIQSTEHTVINVDKLTYAGNLQALAEVSTNPRYFFEKVDICSKPEIQAIFHQYQPDIIMHLAAESHVDRSIDTPASFIETNIIGTFVLLEIACDYWKNLAEVRKKTFRFHHISTDEVYGDLAETSGLFSENTPYNPSSPYSASKASADHLVQAWHRTYGLPTLITNCSNNYGPYQHPEKLIPLMIKYAIQGKPLPIYGTGSQVRDWLYVDDHVRALYQVVTHGKSGETYNIGGQNERTNLEVVRKICSILDELNLVKPAGLKSYQDLITYVTDRPGHDIRYAIDASKIQRELGWIPQENFNSGIYKTIFWHIEKWQNDFDFHQNSKQPINGNLCLND